jgi:hypothetical protein
VAVARRRPAARPAAPALIAAAIALLAAGVTAAPAAAGWAAPRQIDPPVGLDINPAQIGFSADGGAAISFGVQDEDNPADSIADLVQRAAAGGLSGPRQIPSAQTALALAFAGSTLELLTGTSPAGATCCSSAQVVPVAAGGGFGRPRTVLTGLSGATLGRLITLPGGRLLAAIATGEGVWVTQSSGGTAFAPAGRLTAASDRPQALAVTAMPSGQSVVAWTATGAGATDTGPRQVFAATGSPARAPRGRTAVLTVAGGHQVNELAVAPGPRVPTVAWIDSWFDSQGAYHARPIVTDLERKLRPHPFPDTAPASGLSFAGDAKGDQVIAWQGCASTGSCSAFAALRRAGHNYGTPIRLGPIDASQTPAATISAAGEALVGWIDGGMVRVADDRGSSSSFGASRVVSHTNLASDLALSFGPGEAIAAWTQGTLAQSVDAAVYKP